MHFKQFLALSAMLAAAVFHTEAISGSAPARLECTPLKQGSTMHLKGIIPADEETLNLTISSSESSYKLSNDDAEANLVESFGDGVFTMRIISKAFTTELFAIPSTIKKRQGINSLHATFEAKFTALRPLKIQGKRQL